MSEVLIGQAAGLLARKVGLRMDPGVRNRLARCVREGAKKRGLPLEEHLSLLERDAVAFQDLLDCVTVQETSFFRDPAQFEAFSNAVVPKLPPGAQVWSAGSSNGQEPYSIAMALDECGRGDVQILTTDVSAPAIARTKKGWYSAREIGNLEEARRRAYLVAADGGWAIAPRLKERVSVQRHSLVRDPLPLPPASCSVIFCRNVLIYFDRAEVIAALEAFSRCLTPDGWLFLGFSESLWQVSELFRLTKLDKAFVYRQASSPQTVALAPTDRRFKKRAAPVRERRVRVPDPPAPEESTAIASLPLLQDLFSEGESALNRGECELAATLFRKAAYLDPDHAVAHLQLGLALEACGEVQPARRAYSAALKAIDRAPSADLEMALEGYSADALRSLLIAKTEAR